MQCNPRHFKKYMPPWEEEKDISEAEDLKKGKH
jgi:hypothetical protein